MIWQRVSGGAGRHIYIIKGIEKGIAKRLQLTVSISQCHKILVTYENNVFLLKNNALVSL